MLYTLSAVLGATIALGIREWVEYRDRRSELVANCHHDFEEVPVFGEVKLVCRRCNFQRFKETT